MPGTRRGMTNSNDHHPPPSKRRPGSAASICSKPVLYGFALVLCLLIVMPMSWLVYYGFTDKAGASRCRTS